MKILFDQGTPVPLRKFLTAHEISTAFELGWAALKNGELLSAAEQNSFDILLTTDRNLRYQQNLAHRRIAIIVLTSTSWPRIGKVIDRIIIDIDATMTGSYFEVVIP